MEIKYQEILAGGFHAPTRCRAKYRVAILIPYRDRKTNLIIFLNHMHKFMKKQLLEYQIFLIEQIDKDRFNKGALFNIGYTVSRVFGNWHCYVFHDVDLLPIDGRVLYSCPQQPTHMSSAVDCYDFRLPYYGLFGGVTILKPTHYEAVNGYSNYYWDWGAEDDDMYARLQAQKFPVLHYSYSLGRYATLPHSPAKENSQKQVYLVINT
ncbi:beta-1,4-N-acetylgalactosaminyltransferase bre-4-like [Danaus plexippus]|uniref:beta-1,4-N-acetylgalactosaminyltransferase bre-4-like n=1 Tax=Danaus plexippus TaxID=13037 RepID=UPI002AAF5C64|nr:beta-1,4-N-acetylgalactosaminyltransferase bre-4-like [Danaus plexippus]